MTSSLSWKRSYQLSYAPDDARDYIVARKDASNARIARSARLAWAGGPAELCAQRTDWNRSAIALTTPNGRNRSRTCDLFLVMEALVPTELCARVRTGL